MRRKKTPCRKLLPFHSRSMEWNNALLILVVIGICSAYIPKRSEAKIGLAEWDMSTPGGHVIENGESSFGVCLREANPIHYPPVVYVSNLRRWQFYPDYIIGEHEQGFFIFHEPSQNVQSFTDEILWKNTLDKLLLGTPLGSGWLTPQNGWNRKWLPSIFGSFIAIVIGIGGILWLSYVIIKYTAKSVKRRRDSNGNLLE